MVKQWFKSGSPWIWMTGGAVSISLISVLGLLAMIAWKGLSFFWPSEVVQFELQGSVAKQTVIGEIYDRELVAKSRIEATGVDLSHYDKEQLERLLIKTGNREYVDLDFRWVLETDITSRTAPAELAVFERSKNGNFYGYVEQVIKDGEVITDNKIDVLYDLVERAVDLNDQALDLQNGDIGHINYELERLRLKEKAYQLDNELTDERVAELAQTRAELRAEYTVLEKQLFALRKEAKRDQVTVRDMRGEVVTLPLYQVLDVWFPNDMGFFAKLGHYFVQLGKFVADDPREANTEGGVFPAIFGTVFMVLLMAVIVTPFGVVAAIYLHEYAAKNAVTKMIRIAVINLAGVPSIVYGVFGLGFFVYMLGGSIDQLFYPESSPSPVFGTPGVIWSALTLAILTLPVVIVSTEEGLSRIPSTVRHGSLALGATKAETLWRIIIPMASPAIMTGLILAVARAAGEVAPLMLVGVVKMAPTLPLDGNFPYIHLDRKFMHLGFHIYDVGFQSPNVEAARPLVYATAFLLVSVIIALNITAIGIRNHLREKFRALEH
ncbi:MAG: phosphate ABC transporter permease PstA [Pseudomonadota bacterium]|uniref:Phosphate transport system permease protein PstA n=1 Tax=Pseudoalteromonas lipolytica TaxID=570156 RepID=A0A0P7EN24_9GAMM|nr:MULTISPECIES: phosphate ABC transporter permease PstA [Pseudoalteromonas]MEC8225195.1 phosphate ABC transporter permease PstA [Pseudomonadota bacterium]KPM84219.1 phosphate ABC transporter permease [Pseudoalteromonas lipolytica]MBC7007326.1 phosphate ABC transporter permease PstA [Pseudoalteromonas sp. BZK2]MCF2848102.1 phosphate ABC transporter permease PstA [Pseudoalteromonas sp. PAST1]MCF2917406.1 phosphate ABC transporter permease PstA [Pseudoalteromonas sp. Cn5-37]